jgi:hypothetical protein
MPHCVHYGAGALARGDSRGASTSLLPNGGASVIFAFPTNDSLFALFVAWPAAGLAAVRADLEGQFLVAAGAR